jgi:enterochelin esterase family protein
MNRLLNNPIADTKHFWDSISAQGTPMIELLPDPSSFLLTFLYRDIREDIQISIEIIGIYSDTCYGDKQLRHIPNSDIWYRTYKIPCDLVFSYRFTIKSATDTKSIMDLFNNHRIPIGATEDYSYSLFDYQLDTLKAWFYSRNSYPKGTISEFELESKLLSNSRSIKVYKPYGYNELERYPLIVIFDQTLYIDQVQLPTILDNLIASNTILPCVAIMIDNQPAERRTKELPLYQPFANFVAQELMPWAHEKFCIAKDPEKTIIAGVSYGGLAASYIAYCYPNIFGNVISQSGSYWRGKKRHHSDTKWLISQYQQSPKLPVRFYLDCGLQETFMMDSVNFLFAHRQMRDVLKTKGYELYYQEFQGGHDWAGWRKTISDGLIIMFDNMKK